jgi:hypothetical protein
LESTIALSQIKKLGRNSHGLGGRSIADNVKTLSEISVIMASGGGTWNGERLTGHMPSALRPRPRLAKGV